MNMLAVLTDSQFDASPPMDPLLFGIGIVVSIVVAILYMRSRPDRFGK